MNLDEAIEYARDQGLTDRQIAVNVRAAADAVRFGRANGTITLIHDDLDAEIEAHPDSVDQLALGGWKRKPPSKEK